MDYQKYLAWTYFGDGKLDADEFARIGEIFSDVDTFIDVGASHGVYTYHAIQHMQEGQIVAIEADPERFRILQTNVEHWTTDSPSTLDVQCIMAAASDDLDLQRETPFYTTGTQISGGLFPVAERADTYAEIAVPLVKVDDFMTNRMSSVLVKIDVEGAELRVLQGSQGLIRSGRARFFVEFSWWGDRARGTSIRTSMRFVWQSGLGVKRRLRSDYLLFPESSKINRLYQMAVVLPVLLPRYVFNTCVPLKIRRTYIHWQNTNRLRSAPQSE